MVVLLVRLEMLGQVDDPLGQDRDLDFRRSGVALGLRVVLDDFGLAFGSYGQMVFLRGIAD